MPTIRYVTNDVPAWGTGAFSPVPKPTPLAVFGGDQIRYLQQWTDAPDPGLPGYANTNPTDLSFQPSYAQVDKQAPSGGRGGVISDTAYLPGLPLAFRPTGQAKHHMAYVASNQNMGPTSRNTHMKIWSDNPLPVPAENAGRVAIPAFHSQPVGTPVATAWPRPFISWPTWGSSRQA